MRTVENSFVAHLARHRGGKALAEASAKLAEVVAAVLETGKPGSVTLTLAVKQATRGQSAVVLADKVTNKVPKVEAEVSFWFGTDKGELLKDDPRQKEFSQFKPEVIAGAQPEAPAAARAVNA